MSTAQRNSGSPVQGPRERTPFIDGHHTEDARAFFESPQTVIARAVREGVLAADEALIQKASHKGTMQALMEAGLVQEGPPRPASWWERLRTPKPSAETRLGSH